MLCDNNNYLLNSGFSPSQNSMLTGEHGGLDGGLWPHQSFLDSPHSHIKGYSVLKACWADMPYVHVQRFSSWLSIDDPYQMAHAP